ncbi:MAG: hypothetical protein ACXWVH_05555, partial [Caulobacteraceae bacterium]
TQAAAAKTTANRAEILWFAQAADILRYAGEPLVVIDERLWAEKPQDIVEALCARLGLRWRGTRLDLYEILNEIADGAEPPSSSKRPSLPLATALYEAVLKMESDAEARAKAHSIAETAELLRPMIAPLLPSHNDLLLPAPRAAETEALTRELESLRETTAELRRQLGAMSNGGGGHIAELQRELDARTAEIRWLQEQHALQLREAEEENELLREASAHLMNGHAAAPADAEEITAARAEIERLQNEMANLNNANERYLARIYELKRALQDRGEGGGLG